MSRRRRRSGSLAALVAACALAIPASAGAVVIVDGAGATVKMTLDGSASNIAAGGSSDESITLSELSVGGPNFLIPPGAGAPCQGSGTQQVTCTSLGYAAVTIDDDRVHGPRDTVDGSASPALLSVAPLLALESPITLIGSPAGDFLGGSNEADEISGGASGDEILARGGADSVEAFDGELDRVDCGGGLDSVRADPIDQLINCEYPLVIVDGDVDGYTTEEDCNDKDQTIYPDAVEIPGNGVDEDCDDKDDSPPVDFIDRDSDDDGVAEPEDCDDRDAKIRPGALEIVGNKVDENCDRVVAPFPLIGSSVHASFLVGHAVLLGHDFTEVDELTVTDIPQGAQVVLTCRPKRKSDKRSCAFSSKTFAFPAGPRQSTSLEGSFRKRKLKPGTVITITISAPSTIGRQVQYRIRKGRGPASSTVCLEPEGKACDVNCACSHL